MTQTQVIIFSDPFEFFDRFFHLESEAEPSKQPSKAPEPPTSEVQRPKKPTPAALTPDSPKESSPHKPPTPPPKEPAKATNPAAPAKPLYETPKNPKTTILRDTYTVPARTKVSMTALLQKLNCHSPSASPSALKVSKRAVGKMAPLHPNRKPAPPPPPRVVRQEKKSKAQRDLEEQWELEWEDKFGEEWWSIPEDEKAKMRRERRDQEWNGD